MVSKAREDLPEPDSPVITTNLSRGMITEMFLRLFARAPFMTMLSLLIKGILQRFVAAFDVADKNIGSDNLVVKLHKTLVKLN